jgi:glycosyltransferase involved in cell wall biosynthesis
MSAPASTRVIPNGVDLTLFHPGDQQAARVALGLPADRPILLFAAAGIIGNPWKDWATLEMAFRQLLSIWPSDGPRPLLVGLGDDAEIAADDSDTLLLPYLAEQSAVAQVFQAADVYVHAAKADTFPTTVLEALACGLPVVASAVGGIPEQVATEGEDATGVLVQPSNPSALARAIEAVLTDTERRARFSRAAVATARAEFDIRMTTSAYLDWFDDTRC